MNEQAQTLDPSKPQPSAIACSNCRARHLKCDAVLPVCGRCRQHRLSCHWVASRRGQRQNVKKGPAQPVPISASSGQARQDALSDTGSVSDGSKLTHSRSAESPNNSASDSSRSHRHSADFNGSITGTSKRNGAGIDAITASSAASSNIEYLVDLYYQHLFNPHPCVIPPKLFRQRRRLVPHYLLAAMRFAGGQFAKGIDAAQVGVLRDTAVMLLSDQEPDDPQKVQALIILAIVLHGRHEDHDAFTALEKAIDFALLLHLEDRAHVLSYCHGNPILEQSFSRTFFELQAIDTLFSLQAPYPRMPRLLGVKTDLIIPCEELEYAECRPPAYFKTIADFEARAFFDDAFDYSPYAYKIEAVRLMGTVQTLGISPFAASDDAEVDAIDSSLSSFWLSLGQTKWVDLVMIDGTVDYINFQAHMIANSASILYYRPRSALPNMSQQFYTACTKSEQVQMPSTTQMSHTVKALQAANRLSAATSINIPLKKHSPCFTCAVAFASIVHLPAYIMSAGGVSIGDFNTRAIKERLQLSLNALNTIAEVWPIALMVKAQLSGYARQVLFSDPVAQAQFAPEPPMVPMPAAITIMPELQPTWFEGDFAFLNQAFMPAPPMLGQWDHVYPGAGDEMSGG